MSFGFSAGDFLSGAELAYKLAQSLSETEGAAQDHGELMLELHVVHKVLLRFTSPDRPINWPKRPRNTSFFSLEQQPKQWSHFSRPTKAMQLVFGRVGLVMS